MKVIFSVILLILLIIPLYGCTQSKYYSEARQITEDLDTLSLIGQTLIIAMPSTTINDTTISILKQYKPGGVILFGYNLNNGSCAALTRDLQNLALEYIKIPLFISIDQEGGRVKRIQSDVTQFPGNFALGVVNDPSKTYTMAQIIGIQLRLAGINMNFAPVLDVNNNPDNPVINVRSFGCEPALCAELGEAYIKGLQKAQCIAVAKHFPGHGDTHQDSHYTLPIIYKTLPELEKVELLPFARAVDAGVECIMTAHIAFPQLGINTPATMSHYFLNDILRKSMKFEGLIITDDLEMKGITGKQSHGNAAINSFKAGADILLISSYENHVQEIINSLHQAIKKGDITKEQLKAKVTKILELKLRYNIMQINNGIITAKRYEPLPNDIKLLHQADALNVELSRSSIVFHSYNCTIENYIIDNLHTCSKVFSKNINLINIFKKENIICNEPFSNHVKTILLVDSSSYSLEELKRLVASIHNSENNIVLLITGNPYPYLKHFSSYPMLMSFSDTDESLRQLAQCLKGEFSPKLSHPCLTVNRK
ncbi:MAG: beta-N-acetylhexosaminidase [Spirochaetes bacterium]|nr:beta-N-acetylhexosaminidase [Spirochaetota bacterium]